jgi:hypothetical protein
MLAKIGFFLNEWVIDGAINGVIHSMQYVEKRFMEIDTICWSKIMFIIICCPKKTHLMGGDVMVN